MGVAPTLSLLDPSQHVDLLALLGEGLLTKEVAFAIGEVLEVQYVVLLHPRLDSECFSELFFVGEGGLVRLAHRLQLSKMMSEKIFIIDINSSLTG